MRTTLGCGLVALFLASSAVWAEETPSPAASEEIDPDVLRKVRKALKGTLSAEATERETGWNTLRDMGNLAVPGLLALCRRKDTEPEMLARIILALGEARDARVAPVLVELLKAGNLGVRRDAARALGGSGAKEAFAALEALAADPKEDEDVRLAAAIGAARLGGEQGFVALRELAKSPEPQTRSRAVFALGEHGGVAQLEPIVAALADANRDVREDVVIVLQRVGGRAVWGALVKAATADEDYKIRAAAQDALRRLTGKRFERPAEWEKWWAAESQKQPEPKPGDQQPLRE